jgi:DNA-binding CsgD family transcriptional regulator
MGRALVTVVDDDESLTHRERQVMALMVVGLLNKQVGGELGISEITVKAHRGQGDAENESRIPSRPRNNGKPDSA